MSTIHVTTQEELDQAIADQPDIIYIDSPPNGGWLLVRNQGSSSVVAWGSSRVVARESSTVDARDSSYVVAWDSSRVVAWGSSRVVARESSSVEAWESSTVEAWDSSSVVAWDSSYVVAWGSTTVVALGSSAVVARGSSHVAAWDSSTVEARGVSTVVVRGSARVEAWESSATVVELGSARVEAWESSATVVELGSSTTPQGVHMKTDADVRRRLKEGHSDLSSENLSGLNLRSLDFNKSHLLDVTAQETMFCRSTFHYARLDRADLTDACFCYTSLRGADLRGANLTGVNFQGANLTSTLWYGLHLSGLPSGDVYFYPTPGGWVLKVGCWSGQPLELLKIAESKDPEDWPGANSLRKIEQRFRSLLGLVDICIDHVDRNHFAVEDLKEMWCK